MDKTSLAIASNGSIQYDVDRLDHVQCGHGDDESEGNTPRLLQYIQSRFGSLASFTGSHRADEWDLIIVSQGGMFMIASTLAGCIILFHLKEYYEIVNEARPLSGFLPTDADLFTEMHFNHETIKGNFKVSERSEL